jgi:hypothetical protein
MSTTFAHTALPAPPIGRSRPTEVEARLMQCFADAADDPMGDTRLRRAAADYARSVREQGLPPEKLVIGLKKTLSCNGDAATLPSLREEQLEGHAAVGQTKYARVLQWCIESYYE